MEIISREDFEKIIYSDDAEMISGFEVEIKTSLNIDLEKVNLSITFSNLKFTGKQIQFYKFKKECLHNFRFEQCVFESNLFFQSDFVDLTFIANTFNCDKFTIENKEISILTFDKKNDFGQNEISENNNTFTKGTFKINNCEISNLSIDSLLFQNNSKFEIEECDFKEPISIQNSFLNQSNISNCQFQKDFEYSCVYNKTTFSNCDFFKSTKFEGLLNMTSSFLLFENCTFKELANFNKYCAHYFKLEDITFRDKVSFQECIFNIIKIERTIFEKVAWFDDIQINDHNNCDRKTIRTIKQELQKAENRIDFNRFRAFELAAHYEELDWKWESGFIDKSILFVTKISTDFGNSWRKALQFTIVGGFLIYLFLYIIENREFSIDILNWNNWERLLSGFFRFLLVTDFYNPLEADRIYLTNPLSWLILIFGKIVIAFGIYEMIQSFRKFKA